MSHIIVSSHYIANVAYYKALEECSSYTIEICDNYRKQTFRNRTQILGSNGVIDLTVPIAKVSGVKTMLKDTKIDNSMAWQRVHFRSIMSSYKNAPYYDHYIDRFLPFFEKKYNFLLDINQDFHHEITKILKLKAKESLSSEYIVEIEGDLRDSLSKKEQKEQNSALFKPYYQVFSEKMDFVQNLSALDLIFCQGNNGHLK